MKKTTLFGLACVAFAPLAVNAQLADNLLVFYEFNEQSNTVALDSSGNNRNGTIVVHAQESAGNYGINGVGVSGRAGDHAFNNTAGTMAARGGAVQYQGNLGLLSSVTLTLWYKTADASTDAKALTRLFYTGGGATNYDLRFNDEDSMSFLKRAPEAGANFGSDSILNSGGEWVFLAMTYVQTASGDNLHLYAGTTEAEARLVSSAAVDWGAIDLAGTSGATLLFGNVSNLGRAFDGWLDNVRLYGTQTGSDGALDLSAIRAVQTADLAIPEPSTYALIGAGVALAITFFARRRKRS